MRPREGSLPVSCSFYCDGEILGEPLASTDNVSSLLSPVKSEWSARNYFCEAKNSVSRERSESGTFPWLVCFVPTVCEPR